MLEKNLVTAKIGEEILPLDLGYLPEHFQKKAAAELNETPERREQSIRQIKECIKRDTLTTGLLFDDDCLSQLLRRNKYDVAKAFANIKSYISFRKKNPKLFLGLCYESVVRTLYDRTLTFLPWRCQDGCAIFIVELDNWNPETFPVELIHKAIVIYLLQILREPMTQVNGLKAIIDVKSNPLKHVRQCTPKNMHLIYYGIQEVCPLRYKEVHILNDSLAFKAAWFIIKPFMSEKMKNRIIFHNGPETLQNYFPKAILPKHFGGDLENYQTWDWLKRVTTPEQIATIGGIQNWPANEKKPFLAST